LAELFERDISFGVEQEIVDFVSIRRRVMMTRRRIGPGSTIVGWVEWVFGGEMVLDFKEPCVNKIGLFSTV
jgi:hypothetical protein